MPIYETKYAFGTELITIFKYYTKWVVCTIGFRVDYISADEDTGEIGYGEDDPDGVSITLESDCFLTQEEAEAECDKRNKGKE